MPILIEKTGRVATLTLNSPDTRNALDEEMAAAIVDGLVALDNDAGVGCVIVTGAGRSFSSGGNVKDMLARQGLLGGAPDQIRTRLAATIQQIPMTFERIGVPVIAAVNGHAYGAGCDMAIMCDIRIAGESAVFCESFIKLGIVSGDGGGWLLPRAIGLSRAMEMSLTGAPVNAATALEWGLVSRVVADTDLLAHAHTLAENIAAQAPDASRRTKALLRGSATQSLADNLAAAAAQLADLAQGADHMEAVRAFTERRAAVFERRSGSD